eukprot:COSAG02_NODE_765_length_17396_cov_16.796786_3_plen_112_part_00
MPYVLHQLDDSTTINRLTPDGYGCPTGWINGHGTCFGLFDKMPLGWTEAERKCQAFGASLARIDSRQQNDYVSAVQLLHYFVHRSVHLLFTYLCGLACICRIFATGIFAHE